MLGSAALLATVLAQAVAPRQLPAASLKDSSRGSFAFHYEPSLTEEALVWYSQFELLITHDPLPRDQVDRLHAAGTRLLMYEWATAFYESRSTEWQRSLLTDSGKDDLLHAHPLTGGAGSGTSGAWYFDPSSHAHEFARATDLARRIESAGYDGVFLDATTIDGVHAEARDEYQRRHPGVPYDLAFSRFLIQLRKKLPAGILFTNQGYRQASHYLPYVDWDLTESLITRPLSSIDGAHELRSWDATHDPWNSIQFVMKSTIEPLAARYPQVRFAHLNYMHERSDPAIGMVIAVSQLFNSEGYVAAPAVEDEVHRLYLRNGGQPTSSRLELEGGKVNYRFFENGIVAVTSANKEVTIENRAGIPLRNHLSGELVCGPAITLPAANGEPKAHFFDFDHSSSCPPQSAELDMR